MGPLVVEVLSSGHKTRAILAMLWCEALSGDYKAALPIAAAYEFAHAAALVEDDIIDNSQTKFGIDSIPKKYGTPKSLLVSNYLLFCAPSLIAKYSARGEDPQVVTRLLELVGDSGRLSSEGEFLDLEMSQMQDVSEEMYEKMTSMKTGALVGASSASGALIGAGKVIPEVIDAAYSFGESIGVAYQIHDDLQDYFGKESDTGKAAFWDLKSGKKTLPLIHCLQLAQKDEQDFLLSIVSGSTALDPQREEMIRALLLRYRANEFCNQVAMKFVKKARDSLSVIKEESRAKERLLEVIDYLSVKS